jgi:hypothetical protein
MRVYNAGILTLGMFKGSTSYARLDEAEKRLRDTAEFMLESYHYMHKPKAVDKLRKEGKTYFLDSGAFSAFTQNVTIDIKDYCKYVERYHELFHVSSVLDAIGDYKGTFWNQKKMEELLPREMWPLPCYHYGEPHEVLQYYVDNYEHITIGGMVPISTKQLFIWLDEIWSKYLTHPDGTPKIRVHGFGLTSLPLMMRYPWYSVDSSSWVQFGANGSILLPGYGKSVNISSRSGNRKNAEMHVDTLRSPLQREKIEAEIIEMGCDPDRMRTNPYARWAWNIWAIPEYARRREAAADRLTDNYVGLF